MKNEPDRLKNLHKNVRYASTGLKKIGINMNPQSAILALRVPETINIRDAACHFHRAGIFVNSIEYPAVPLNQQRFRISLMASHTKDDIDRLISTIEEVWTSCNEELNLQAS